jgi:hypothetical protein
MNSQHGARFANIILGIWLILSSFIWRDAVAHFVNDWVVGVLIALVALAAFWLPSLRHINSIIAIWLFLSPFWMVWQRTATFWNCVIVAILVFSFSLARSPEELDHEP